MLSPSFDSVGDIPPLEKLKGKVLIKGKMVPFVDEDDEEEATKEDENLKQVSETKHKQPPNIAPELSVLTHLKATGFKGFEESKKFKAWEMCSFAEGKTNKFVAKKLPDFIGFNAKQLSRIYPAGMRVDSSNYDPVPAWCSGAQIVALNYQTGAEPTFLNDGKFLDNGRSGYVLKPKFMREEKSAFNPTMKQKVAKTLYVQIISGWQLPKVQGKETSQKGEVIDPYVKIKLRGSPIDKQKPQKTKVIKSNGFNPIWEADYKFPLHYPDLAILYFEVSDADLISKDDFIGQYALPVSSIREGFRYVPLKDNRGVTYDKASLLCQFKWL